MLPPAALLLAGLSLTACAMDHLASDARNAALAGAAHARAEAIDCFDRLHIVSRDDLDALAATNQLCGDSRLLHASNEALLAWRNDDPLANWLVSIDDYDIPTVILFTESEAQVSAGVQFKNHAVALRWQVLLSYSGQSPRTQAITCPASWLAAFGHPEVVTEDQLPK